MNTPLLEVADLGVSYETPAGRVTAVHDVSFSVSPGEVLAIVGESGSGKTTTANAIIGLLPPGGRIDTGRVVLAGQNLVGRPESELRTIRGRQIGLVAQDPAVSLDPVKRIGAQVAEVLAIHGLAKREAARARAVELLEQAGLPNADVRARQYPHELSGGMQQRVLIAVALASSPQLLIADEPTSALDVTIQRQILDHLERLSREIGVTVLMITHDLAVASDRAHRILVMSEGRVVEEGQARELLSSPGDAYTRRLIASDPSLNSYRTTALHPVAGETPDDAALVYVDSVVKEYGRPNDRRGEVRRAVDGVSLTVRRGETLALVGESGSGKTTLARLVLGLSPVTAGTITFDGHVLTGIDAKQLRGLRRRMQIIYQNPYSSLDPRWTVAQIVEEPLRVHHVGSRAERHARARELLEHVALPATMLKRKRSELSGGQCQRVAIARALALGPDLLVCDEPVSALDVTVQDQILRLLTRLQHEFGLTMLFISHDLSVVRQIADRVAVMSNGTLVELEPTEALFDSPQHDYTRQLLDAIPGEAARCDERGEFFLTGTIVDFHSHYVDPGLFPEPPPGTSSGLARCWPALTDWDGQLAGLGGSGVDRRVISSPAATLAGPGRTLGGETIRAVNDSLARRAAEAGGRISALATVDAFAGDAGAAEAARGVTELGLAGICVDCCHGEWLLDAARARPALEVAAALGVPVFAHPVGPPSPDVRFERLGGPGRLLARGSEAALSLLAVLRGDLLEELPRLRLVVPMIAVAGLYYAGERPRSSLFIDTMGLSPPWVRLAIDLLGVRQVVVGTDYPVVNDDPSRGPVEALLRETGLDEAGRASISSSSALALLDRQT